MDRVVTCVRRVARDAVERVERVNCHHNYTEQEKHFGKDGVAVPQGRDRRAGGRARG